MLRHAGEVKLLEVQKSAKTLNTFGCQRRDHSLNFCVTNEPTKLYMGWEDWMRLGKESGKDRRT
jgi:hypothetical protein